MDQVNNERRWYRVSDDGMAISAYTARQMAEVPAHEVTPSSFFTCLMTALLVGHERRRVAAIAAAWDVEDAQTRRAITEAHLRAFASAQASVLTGVGFGS